MVLGLTTVMPGEPVMTCDTTGWTPWVPVTTGTPGDAMITGADLGAIVRNVVTTDDAF